jgi:cell division protein FtsQ
MAQNLAAPHPLDVRLMHTSANLLFALVVLVLAFFGVRAVAKSNWFEIRQVQVVGDTQHNNAATLRAHALSRLHGTYLTMDLRAARAVFEEVPWVKRAVVRRVWPHTLVAELQEHRPAAYWEREAGENHLVDADGEVFEVNLGDVEDANLPTLRGPDQSAPQVLSMHRRLRPIVEGLGGSIDRLALSDRGSWQIKLERGAVMELGRGTEDEVVQRTRQFAATVTQAIAGFGARVETVDLRHQGGYAVKLAGVSVETNTTMNTNLSTNLSKKAPGPGKGR